MKIRLVPKKKPAPQPGEGRFVTGIRLEGGDAFVTYDTGSAEAVKVYLFDALGHFVAGAEKPAGTLRIPDAAGRGDPSGLYRLFVRLPDGSESMEDIVPGK
ncbi:MAG: hypothetical protein IKM31_01940 [Oscillospiraceae bacterium]|nr:hypothetical protein [Oscillospiraceae bacterium]